MPNYQERLQKEREAFEMNHLDITAVVLVDWGLPNKITEIIANQADYNDASTEEQNVIIELARFLYDMELKSATEIRHIFKNNHELKNNLAKQRITISIDRELVNKLFDETKSLVDI